MYISGQLGMDTASGQLVPGGVQAQAKQVRHTLGASGVQKRDLLPSLFPME